MRTPSAPETQLRHEYTRVVLAMTDSFARRPLAQALRAEGFQVLEAGSPLQLLGYLAHGVIATVGRVVPDAVVIEADFVDVLVGLRRTLTTVAVVVLAPGDAARARDAAVRVGAALVIESPPTTHTVSRALRALEPPLRRSEATAQPATATI
jgi:PleD family two-component response regulator